MFLLSKYNIESFLIRDPIYDYIEVPKEFQSLLDHKLVQRLRWINQLPLEQLVYPSAQHSRFEHSIGVMYLAMFAANSLIQNSMSELNKSFKEETQNNFVKDKQKNFILTAGLVGLLHDIGHAPFSHTLEEACKYSNIKYKYDHEDIGLLLVERILKETDLLSTIWGSKTLSVLNKKFKLLGNDLTKIGKILRTLVDGPIDVDKGDYVIRDSYHCGTTYGIYDIQRLWRNVVINPIDFTIAVNKKGALEAWTLRYQRYHMFKNVYKHHTRNITDAMLIDIISESIKMNKNKGKIKYELLPVWQTPDEIKTEENISRFIFWTDDGMLKYIANQKNNVSTRIEEFLKREIYKRGDIINLETYPEALAAAQEKGNNKLHIHLIRLKENLKTKKGLYFDFLIEKDVLPPVWEKSVQTDLKVLINEKDFIPLAKYLQFSPNKGNIEDNSYESLAPSNTYNLHIYIKNVNLQDKKDYILKQVRSELDKFNKI